MDNTAFPTNDFQGNSSHNASEATIGEHTIITLTERDSVAFAEALLNPREPNEALRAAFALYNEDVADTD
jgi:uncharacterized protein (DUF1778 family)